MCGKRVGIMAVWAAIVFQMRQLSAGITLMSDFEMNERSYLRGIELSHGVPLSYGFGGLETSLDPLAGDASETKALDSSIENPQHLPAPLFINPFSFHSKENMLPPMSPEEMTLKLQRSWQHVKNEPSFHKVPFIVPRRRPVEQDAITVAVHADTNRFNRLLFLIQRWQGPVSVSIYIQSADEIAPLVDFVTTNAHQLAWTDIHVLMEDNIDKKEYPHNPLREMALRSVETEYFLALDVDFVTTPNAHDGIHQLIQRDSDLRMALHNRTWMVLPAFERILNFSISEETILTIEKTKADVLPNNKEEVLMMWDKEELDPFHLKRVEWGHGSTNFTRWYMEPEKRNKRKERPNFYPINYVIGFEPYVLGCKCENEILPKYWPTFRGFGYNKFTFFVEAHYMGFEFAVLEDYFVVHLPHPYGKRRPNKDTNHELDRFAWYMKKKFNLSNEELDEIA